MSVSAWVAQRLWQPAGMAGEASWSLDSEASGFEKLESGFNARALDYARFGQLVLDEGVALSKARILPADWAAPPPPQATGGRPPGYYDSPEMRFLPGLAYHRLWWIVPRADGPADVAAMGKHGQFIYVSARHRIVVVRNGATEGGLRGLAWLARFQRFVDELGRTAAP
jgi:CubicO group peptidase (beta-lactamase class C family)